MTQQPGNSAAHLPPSRYHIHGEATDIHSDHFRVRRISDVMVIENLTPRLVDDDELRAVFDDALGRPGVIGIVMHFPAPRYVKSTFVVTIRELGKRCVALSVPFLAVVHPKMRLLLDIFDLGADIPTEERLDLAVREICERAGRPYTG